MHHQIIATRIIAIIGRSLLFSLAVIAFLLLQLGRINSRYEEVLADEIAQQAQARTIELHFKQQVQEWNSILLRGQNPLDLEKHRATFLNYKGLVRLAALGWR